MEHHTTYQSYRGLPSLAGVCSFEDAMRPGLSVDACVTRLKRYHYAFKRLHQMLTARITAEPIYELKMGWSLQAHICAEYVAALRKRVAEMREPPLHLDIVPDTFLEIFFDEIRAAPSTEALVLGLYEKAFPALQAALQRHLEDTNPLVDQPSVRLCRLALFELNDILAFGTQAVQGLVDEPARTAAQEWLGLLDNCLLAAGGLDGAEEPATGAVQRRFSAQPYVYDGRPRRDERFQDPYNMGVNAEAFLYDEHFAPQAKVLMMFFKRMREIDVPEMMASIITETSGKPWEYYQEMSRQVWDEARHALMGEVGLVSLGLDWRKIAFNFTWSLTLNTELTPLERHGVLYYIERGLMSNTGKRFEWEVGVASHDPLAATFQDYDWADEVLHAHIGRAWYVPEFANLQEALAYGDHAWSRVMSNWQTWRDQGLTQHRNWWPELYRDACVRWGIEPDKEVLAFSETYEETRADRKPIVAPS
ncbi:MAG TPA: hypothetical protein VKT82_31495 [Ktedonobacterales bacterium]|nr:hypothetical protein [Ktedonobacterales bacterium]